MSHEELRNGLTIEPEIEENLKSSKVVKVEKYSLSESRRKQNPENFFSREFGVILLHLENGNVIGFAEDPIKESVVSWFHTKDGERDCPPYYDEEYGEKKEITDSVYGNLDVARKLIGEKISSIRILKDKNEPLIDFPDSNEKVIILETESGVVAISDGTLNNPMTLGVGLCDLSEVCPERISDHEMINL